jgi:hypothetical protein
MMSLEPNPEVVDNWQRLAVEFAKSFIARYQGTAVTPYMHVFVYHVGHFMKKLGSIESFANYDIESWHKINKRVRSCATSFLGGRHKNANTSFTAQQLGWHRRTVGSPLPKTIFGEWTKKYLDDYVLKNNTGWANIMEMIRSKAQTDDTNNTNNEQIETEQMQISNCENDNTLEEYNAYEDVNDEVDSQIIHYFSKNLPL